MCSFSSSEKVIYFVFSSLAHLFLIPFILLSPSLLPILLSHCALRYVNGAQNTQLQDKYPLYHVI
jgi:hypothetical protein